MKSQEARGKLLF